MDLRFSPAEEAFRAEVRSFLAEALRGSYAALRGRGGPGDEHTGVEGRKAWERVLGRAGWIGLGWPKEHGGRGRLADGAGHLPRGVRARRRPRAPRAHRRAARRAHAPRLRHRGAEAALPPAHPRAATELWCQGYSEPNAGSDLANVQTRAEQDGDGVGHHRAEDLDQPRAHSPTGASSSAGPTPSAPKHRGLSYLLVPMRQPGVDRPSHHRR